MERCQYSKTTKTDILHAGASRSRSDMFAAENAAKVKDTNATITLVEVDAGHDVAGDAPEALIAEVTKFLGETS